MRFLCQWLTSCPHLCVWKYAFSLSSKTHRGSIRVHTTVLMRSFVKRSKTIELHVYDVSWTLCSMHHLQTHAPEIFSIIVSIMMRFRPSILIRFVCVFVLIHFQERFQIDVLSVRTEGLNIHTKRIEMYTFSNENSSVWTGPKRLLHTITGRKRISMSKDCGTDK